VREPQMRARGGARPPPQFSRSLPSGIDRLSGVAEAGFATSD
jgi:hypothetical protein